MSKERLNESLNLYYQERLEQKINMIILDKLNHFKDNGYDIYFISASIEPIVKFISSKLGAKAGFGTTLLECNGDYNGNIDNDLLGKNSKKNILENIINIDSNIDILNSYAFSDSENDLNQWNVIGNKFLVVNNDIYEYER